MTGPEDLLSAYLDGELTADERAELEQALAASPKLRGELHSLDRTRTLLRRLPEVEPRRPISPPRTRAKPSAARVRRLGVAVVGVAAIWLVILGVGIGLGSLPVVPDVDQLALQHAAASGPSESTDMGFRAMTIEQMADDPAILDDIGPGMEREAIFQLDDVVQVRYSDGLHTISVFHQPGEVDWDAMPESGEMEMMDLGPVWSTTMGDVDVLVAERGDLIVTVVADGDMDHEMSMMATKMVPEVDMDNGLWSRVVDAPGNIIDRF